MDVRKIITFAAAAVMCAGFACCGSKDNSSSESTTATASAVSSAETTSENSSAQAEESSAAEPAAVTDYDVDGDYRAFDDLKEKYADGYLISLTGQLAGSNIDYTICVKDGKAYEGTTVQGMKSYVVIPGDGKSYNVSEGTTTYSVTDEADGDVSSSDVLFGATLDFDHAVIEPNDNVVFEYYKLDETVAGQPGFIVYGFNGNTYDLKQVVLVPDGGGDPIYFMVNSIAEADESMLEVPDLSAYTEEIVSD